MQSLTITDWQILSSLALAAAALLIVALVIAFQAGYEHGYRVGTHQQRLFGHLKLNEHE
jgi:hypothetical protein